MVAPSIAAVDLRCATEFAHPDDKRVFKRSARAEVFEECREGFVGLRQKALFELLEISRMGVPGGIDAGLIAMPVNGDEFDPRFEQAPREQQALSESMPAITLARGVGFALEIEGSARFSEVTRSRARS